jgi:sarcosine oxidase subunit beta
MPAMNQGSVHSAHGGYDGITPDQHPILGAAGPDGYYLDCGHSGTGFKTAPAVGLCMAELILEGASKTVDISPLAPGRFAAGRLIKGNYENIWK